MWRQLTPAEQARLLGSAMVGGGVLALAIALLTIAWQVRSLQQDLPEFFLHLDGSLEKVGPALHDVDAIRKLIPPILAEVKATRELVPSVVAEVAAVRQALPPLIEQSAAALNNASGAVRAVEPHIPAVLGEVKKTREALPGLLDRADQLVARASTIGKEAGKEAAEGAITGVFTAPFRIIGKAGKGLADSIGLGGRADFTAEDERLAADATRELVQAGETGGRRSWLNKKTGARGTVALLARDERAGRQCMTMRYHVELKSGKVHDRDVELCRQSDGTWAVAKQE
jgi:surface antigen